MEITFFFTVIGYVRAYLELCESEVMKVSTYPELGRQQTSDGVLSECVCGLGVDVEGGEGNPQVTV